MSVGKRIYTRRPVASPQLMEQLGAIPASNIADVMGRSCAMAPRIRRMSTPPGRMVGQALTVKCCAGDNLLIHKALAMAGPGDVLVISNEGGSQRALLGEVMASYGWYTRHIAGIVADGPIRDIDAISGMPLPVYATGTTPGGPYKEGPGEINVPVACGNISVAPGDIILGDADGVIVIPLGDAPQILPEAVAFQEQDEKKLREAIAGRTSTDWIEAVLEQKGFEIRDSAYQL